MTEAGLSKEELDWCALVVTGVTRGEAVKKAFNRSDLSDAAARQKASRLSRKPEIVTELSRLRQATEQAPVLRKDLPAILTRQEIMKKVLHVVDDAERDGDKLKGLELYSKLAGYSQPEQSVKVNVAVGTSFSAVMKSVEKGEQGQ